MASILFFSFLILTIPSRSIASSESLLNAAETLSNSGYLSMALTLQLTCGTLNLDSPRSATIFAPPDSAFARHGQLSLLDLKYHISPKRFSEESFRSLPYGARIPTLRWNHSLIVTSDPDLCFSVSINNIPVWNSPIFDDGIVIVYAVDGIFDPNQEITNPRNPNLAPAPAPCPESVNQPSPGVEYGFREENRFSQAADSLMFRGFTKIAAFLDMQLLGFSNLTKLTIFAPVDEAIEEKVKSFRDYSSIFIPHVIQEFLPWDELNNYPDGTILPTFAKEFVITVKKSGDIFLVNDVPVIYPDMYKDEWIVVHGLNGLVIPSGKQSLGEDSISELDGYGGEQTANDGYGEP